MAAITRNLQKSTKNIFPIDNFPQIFLDYKGEKPTINISSVHLLQQMDGLLHIINVAGIEALMAIVHLHAALCAVLEGVFNHLAKDIALIEWAILILNKEKAHSLVLQHNALGAKVLAQTAQLHHADEFLTLLRDGTKTVDHATAELLYLIVRHKTIQLTIKQHSLGARRYVFLGEEHA